MNDAPNPVSIFFQQFVALTEQQQISIAAAFRRKKVSEGTFLFAGDKVCRELYFVHSGVLKIMTRSDEGADLVYFFVKENQFCTLLHSFTEAVIAEKKIAAACDAEVFAISKNELTALYNEVPALKPVMDQLTQQRLMEKVQLRNSLAGKDATARYKLFLAQHADLALRVSLQDIASFLDITPQSLSRIRKRLIFS